MRATPTVVACHRHILYDAKTRATLTTLRRRPHGKRKLTLRHVGEDARRDMAGAPEIRGGGARVREVTRCCSFALLFFFPAA